MSFKPHLEFAPPQDAGQRIWRYTDFAKFASMLLTNTLFFCRADLLGDPFEGSISLATASARDEFYKRLKDTQELPDTAINQLRDLNPKFTHDIRKAIFVNSWNMSDFESPALWHQYARDTKGVAIQSTYQRLVDAFQQTAYGVNIGTVRYVDYETDFIPQNNALTPILHKRKSFDHEHELRAVIMKVPTLPNHTIDNATIDKTRGLEVPVDLNVLVERVHIAPDAPRLVPVGGERSNLSARPQGQGGRQVSTRRKAHFLGHEAQKGPLALPNNSMEPLQGAPRPARPARCLVCVRY